MQGGKSLHWCSISRGFYQDSLVSSIWRMGECEQALHSQCVGYTPPLRSSYLCRTYQLKAESPADVESWMSALRHTQVSGIPLAEQLLTNSNVPIIVHKCLQFVESTGIDMEGLYRISGEKAKIRKLILAFNQGESGWVGGGSQGWGVILSI